MPSQNKTPNYNLTQYADNGTDKISVMGDYNKDMSKIDTAMESNAELATKANETSQTAIAKATQNAKNIASNSAKITTNSANITSLGDELRPKISKNQNDITALQSKVTDIVAARSQQPPLTTHKIISAHRGGSTYPEESLRGCEWAWDQGFVPEMDAQLLNDGKTLALCHDDTANRTMSGVSGSIQSISPHAWSAARVKGSLVGATYYPAPFLEDVLQKADKRMAIIEVKQTTRACSTAVANLVKKYHLENSMMIECFSEAECIWLASQGFHTMFLSSTFPDTARLERERIEYAGVYDAAITQANINTAHANGVKVLSWTTDDPAKAADLWAWGIDGIISNEPDVISFRTSGDGHLLTSGGSDVRFQEADGSPMQSSSSFFHGNGNSIVHYYPNGVNHKPYNYVVMTGTSMSYMRATDNLKVHVRGFCGNWAKYADSDAIIRLGFFSGKQLNAAGTGGVVVNNPHEGFVEGNKVTGGEWVTAVLRRNGYIDGWYKNRSGVIKDAGQQLVKEGGFGNSNVMLDFWVSFGNVSCTFHGVAGNTPLSNAFNYGSISDFYNCTWTPFVSFEKSNTNDMLEVIS